MKSNYLKWIKTLFDKPKKYIALRRFSTFKELSSFELYLLNNFMHRRTYKLGELLFDKDYPLEVVYFIEKGEIEVQGKLNPTGKAVLKKNQFIGLIDMFYESTRSSSAIALSEVEALAISRFDLLELINNNPRMGVKILTGVCKSFSQHIFSIAESKEI